MATFKRPYCLGQISILCWTVFVSLQRSSSANITIADIDLSDPHVQQRIRLFNARRACYAQIVNVTAPSDGGLYCSPVWDNILCWTQYVPAGSVVAQRCPSYVHNFNQNEQAFRRCTENGTWETHPDQKYTNRPYTDFSNCHTAQLPSVVKNYMSIATKIATIGYSISIAALVLAIFILACFKKLHCQRNTIHINLFASFLLRAVISVMRNSLLVHGLALPSDLVQEDGGTINFSDGSINFFFFLNITRVLFTKIRDCNSRDVKRYKKLAKSTLVLIPMFGAYYIVFIILSRIDNHVVSTINIFIELPVSSIQVQAEVLKRWDRHRLRSQSLTSGRSSRAFSTGSFYMGRDRTSVCHATISTQMNTHGDSEGNGSMARVSEEPDICVRELNEMKVLESVSSSAKQQSMPRAPGSPKVSFRRNDSRFAKSFPFSQTSKTLEETKTVPDCIKDCGDTNSTKPSSSSQNLPKGIYLDEEQVDLIPKEKFKDSCSELKSNGTCLSLVRGGQVNEDECKPKNVVNGRKGNNQETHRRQPNATNNYGLSVVDCVDAINESQPILA
ncbi:parathyroid hormone/parathyroid hormone-related peptide receptor-like [Elysia marginata]|uniref:Parathyroid hormone/parathyroid hormone-related peptide receptor-like n=1 Tax=Elysia marginata TaxID=1093978 RepID=A0AAV4HGE8_9GAST|nr:parathyroid hormone/parathyroid hormone-related peptide receptor-like [Elysia marginata]